MIVRIRIAAMWWSGVTSAWFVEPTGRRTATMVDGIVADSYRGALNRGDVVEAELVPEHADSYQHATDRHAYLVVGEIVAAEGKDGWDDL